MKVRNTILAALLAAGSLALAAPLATQARPMGKEGCETRHGMKGERDGLSHMMKRLDLTPEQQDKISAVRQRDAATLAEKSKAMRDSRARLHDMRIKGEYDEAKVKALTEQGAQAMAEMGQLRARQMHAVMQILTPEQREQVEAKRERMRKHWEEHRDERRERG